MYFKYNKQVTKLNVIFMKINCPICNKKLRYDIYVGVIPNIYFFECEEFSKGNKSHIINFDFNLINNSYKPKSFYFFDLVNSIKLEIYVNNLSNEVVYTIEKTNKVTFYVDKYIFDEISDKFLLNSLTEEYVLNTINRLENLALFL